jgi:hypothetical protein
MQRNEQGRNEFTLSEPQDIFEWLEREKYDAGLRTVRIFFRAAFVLLQALLILAVSWDVQRVLPALGPDRYWVSIVAVLYVASVVGFVWGTYVLASEYWELNLISQGWVLFGFQSVVRYLQGRHSMRWVCSELLLAVVFSGLFEVLFGLWKHRRRDAEEAFRLKRTMQWIGAGAAAVVLLLLLIL